MFSKFFMSLNLNNTNPFVLQILCFNMSSINSSLFYSKNEDVITPVWPGNNIDSDHESSSENEEEKNNSTFERLQVH